MNSKYKKYLNDYFSDKAEFWRDIYRSPQNSDIHHYQSVTNRKQIVLDHLDQFAGDRTLNILDVGSGSGGVAESLLRRGHRVVCVDISFGMLKVAQGLKKKHEKILSILRGDIEQLPFKTRQFDVVICLGLFQFLEKDGHAIREISQVLEEDGMMFISLLNIFKISNFLDPYYYFVRTIQYIKAKITPGILEGQEKYDVGKNKYFKNKRYYFNQLNGLFRKNGLRVMGQHPIGFGPLTFWGKRYCPEYFSLQLNQFLQNRIDSKKTSPLKYVANEWVLHLGKIS